MKRCINIDWLEVYALETMDEPRNDEYFIRHGWEVRVRHYGTRQYAQMFTLIDAFGHPFIEVRRAPYTSLDKKTFIPPNGCHLRFHNRTCYATDAVALMRDFLSRHGFEFKRIYRIDLALDFIRFDSGDYPADFIKRYLTGVYTKINQCTISAHGEDTWHERQWHSLKWGQLTSDVNTKLYCKSLELQQVGDKPYIRQAWFEAGLVDDPVTLMAHKSDGTPYTPDIWRLEFSIKSNGRKVFVMREGGDEHGHRILMANSLLAYEYKASQLFVFYALLKHYFCFKIYRANVRKSRCKDKVLFHISPKDSCCTISTLSAEKPHNASLDRLVTKLECLRMQAGNEEVKRAVVVLVNYIHELMQREQLADPYDTSKLKALQFMLHEAMTHKSSSYTERQIQELVQLFKDGKLY